MLHIRYKYFESQLLITIENFKYKTPKFIHDPFLFIFGIAFAFSGGISVGHFIGWEH